MTFLPRERLPACVLLAALLPATSANSDSGKAASEGPRARLSAESFDFGTVRAGTTCSGQITIDNEGDAPLAITRVGVTCACATIKLSTARRLNVPIEQGDEGRTDLTLEPGGQATLELKVDTAKLPGGPFEKRLMVVSSDPGRRAITIPFAVNVDRPPKPEPPAIADAAPDAGPQQPGRTTPLVAPGGPPPHIESDSYKAEFGRVYRGEKLHHTFKLKNTGEGDLEVFEIRNNCSCAASKFTIGGRTWLESEIVDAKHLGVMKPGEEATLEVELKTAKATRAGKDVLFSKSIRVYSNDLTRNPLVLNLDALMTSPFAVSPEMLHFGAVKKGQGARQSVVIYSDELGSFDIARAVSPNAELLEVTATRLEVEEGIPPSWRIDATLSAHAPLGTFNGSVDLEIDHERVKEIPIPVYFMVEPNVSFTGNKGDGGSFLDFGVMTAAVDKTVELVIENGDASVPYVPREVTVEARPRSDAFVTEIVEVEPGMRYVLKVTAPAALAALKFFQGDVVIQADHPDVPVKKVRFRGWYRLEDR